jgi:hypothetical protein
MRPAGAWAGQLAGPTATGKAWVPREETGTSLSQVKRTRGVRLVRPVRRWVLGVARPIAKSAMSAKPSWAEPGCPADTGPRLFPLNLNGGDDPLGLPHRLRRIGSLRLRISTARRDLHMSVITAGQENRQSPGSRAREGDWSAWDAVQSR